MAYQSRAATFYANTSYAGLVNQGLYIEIAGVDATRFVESESFELSLFAHQPSTIEFAITKGAQLQIRPGMEIVIRNGGAAGALIFGGHCLQRRIRTGVSDAQENYDLVSGMDYTWLLDRYQFVTARYYDRPFQGIVSDLLTFADPASNFTAGIVEPTGSITIDFETMRISECLRRLAACTESLVWITPRREVSLLSTVGTTWAVGAAASALYNLEIDEDIAQSRTRVFVEGEGSELAVDFSAGGSTMVLTEATWASAAGGSGVLRDETFTYAGVDGVTLTGVSGAPDGYVGDSVNLIVQADDVAAQTTIANTLGGSQSGVIEFYIRDNRQTLAEATARAGDELISGNFGALVSASFDTQTRTLRPGQIVTFTATKIGPNRFFSETVHIDSVVLTTRGGSFADGDELDFVYRVDCTPVKSTLSTLLARTIEIR